MPNLKEKLIKISFKMVRYDFCQSNNIYLPEPNRPSKIKFKNENKTLQVTAIVTIVIIHLYLGSLIFLLNFTVCIICHHLLNMCHHFLDLL